jgi:cell fate regulator YaaT (PSP1 superfamily)
VPLVEVAFKGNRKEFYLWEGDLLPARNVAVVVEAERGEDLGVVRAVGTAAELRAQGVPHRPTEEGPTLRVRRLASLDDLRRNEELRSQDEDSRRKAVERARAAGLAMKITDAEWRWDRRKLTLYFTAERRVDFRNLVRELATLFRTRIELKQIGVRDEAKRLGGIGRCGREYCSASWLPELRPVNLGVARDQRLSLNPTQISGACGRLMCCLRYEHEFYVQQRRRFPKEGKWIATSKGDERVVANDIFRERVTLRNADGESRVIALADLRREWKNPPNTLEVSLEEESTLGGGPADEIVSEELLRLQDTSEMPAWLPSLRDARPSGGSENKGRALPLAEPSNGPPRPRLPEPARESRDQQDQGTSEERAARGPGRRRRGRRGRGRRPGDAGGSGREPGNSGPSGGPSGGGPP